MIEAMLSVPATYANKSQSIEKWRRRYLRTMRSNRKLSDLAIFGIFINALLERAMSGESSDRRRKSIGHEIRSFADYRPTTIARILKNSGYRFPNAGKKVVCEAKEIVAAPSFAWKSYFKTADRQYSSNYADDLFLKISGVSFKTRDLALSHFSTNFAAIDLHVVRVATRTGMLLHGYGAPELTTAVTHVKGYMFFHDLIIELARLTGWPSGGFSPGEIDRTLWHFGRTICKAEPMCGECPVASQCVTAMRQQGSSSGKIV